MKPTFTLTDLGVLPGGSMSQATAMNNHGQVVGWGGSLGSPFLWTAWLWQEGVMSALAMPNKDLTSQASGINDLGQIIGRTYHLVGDHTAPDDGALKTVSVGAGGMRLGNKGHTPYLPFLVRGGQAEFFVHPDQGHAILRAINNKGDVLGWIDTFHPAEPERPPRRKSRRSFLRSEGELRHIAASDGGKFQAYGLNDLGRAIGTANSPDGEHASHAWLWQNDRMTDLGSFGGYSIPHDINAAGQVVGVSSTDEEAEDNSVHGFLWENGRIINLDGTSKARESRPRAINACGQVVGQSDTEDGPICGFLWQDGKMFDLNELVIGASDWDIFDAVGINDIGQIACNGEYQGITHGILLTPRRN